jgi:hypothetical protein
VTTANTPKAPDPVDEAWMDVALEQQFRTHFPALC